MSTPVSNKMRQAYLMAALDTRQEAMKEGFIARSYVEEKLRIAFKATEEETLLGHLDLQRRTFYSKYLREMIGLGER